MNDAAQTELDCYDAGLLDDFGAGEVNWWQDYLRAELGRAHDFYTDQFARHVQAAEARGRAEGYEQAIREGVKRLEQEFAVRSSKVGGIMSGGGRDYDIGRATGYAHAAAILKLLENRE